MATNPNPEDAVGPRFLLVYFSVAASHVSSTRDVLTAHVQELRTNEGVTAVLVQRTGGAPYNQQFNVFVVWPSQAALDSHLTSRAYADLLSQLHPHRSAPPIVKSFKRLPTSSFAAAASPLPWSNDAEAIVTVTHLDVIPSIAGNVAGATSDLTEAQAAALAAPGVHDFFALQQLDRANHFSFVQVWTSITVKANNDEAPATVAFKDAFYARGPCVGGCPWDEQYCRIVV